MAGQKLTQEQIQRLSKHIRAGSPTSINPGRTSTGMPGTRAIPVSVRGNSLLGKGEGRHIPGIGAVATALNILDQGHSAITGGLRASLKPKNFFDPGEVASEFWKGLKGDTHTSYADILDDSGIHNPLIKGTLGFGMDVILDPLTYVGLGKVGAGGLAEGTAKLLAGKELGEQAVKASAETAAAKAAAVATTAKSPGKAFGYAAKAEEVAPPPVISQKAIAERAQQMMAEHPTNWEFRYGLPTATPRTIAIKQPDAITNMLHGIANRSTGEPRTLVKALSRKAEQPHGLAEMERVLQGANQADFSDQYGVLKRIFSRMSPEDRRYAYLRYEKPEKYENKALDWIEAGKFDRTPALDKLGFNSIDDVVNEVRGIHKKILDAELSQGRHIKLLPTESKTVMHDGVPFLEPRTVPWSEITDPVEKEHILGEGMAGHKLRRIVRNMDALDKMPGLSKTLSSQDRFINLNKLDIEAIPDAAKPIVDIGEATLERLRDTYKMQTHADFVRQAIKKFGINTKEVDNATEIMENLHLADKDGNLRFRPVQPASGNRLIHDEVARLAEFKDYHLPSDIADILNSTHKALTDETAGRALLQQYDRYLGHWKAWNSLASPGYHIRTTMGDFFQNAVAGVWDPRRYKQARDVLQEVKNTRVEDVLSALRNPDLPLNALRDGRASNVFVNIGGAEMPGDRIYQYFHDTGAKSGELVTESLPNTIAPSVDKPSSFGRVAAIKGGGEKLGERIGANVNRYEAKAADIAVGRETHQRMANYINKMDHEVTASLKAEAKARHMNQSDLGAIRDTLGPERVQAIEQKAAEAASAHTRKYNIDYGQLSSFEKDVMRRVVPFYSWFRLNAPQQLAQLASHPGVMTMAPKLMNGIEEILGTQDASGDFMIPDWIRESLPMRVAMAGQAAHNPVSWAARKLTGVGDDNAVFVPSLAGVLPMQDLETVLGPISRANDVMQMRGGPTNWHNWMPAAWSGVQAGAANAANMTNPAIKGLFEAATQKSSFSGGDITNFNDWALSQLGGPSRQLSKLTGISDAPSIRGLSALLVGLPLQEVSQKRQKGEYQRRSDILTPEIARMKSALAKKKGISKESKRYEKISSKQIREYQAYLKKAKRAVGS